MLNLKQYVCVYVCEFMCVYLCVCAYVCESVCVCSGGGGTYVYWQYVYVRPTRGPFHALPAFPKDIFFTDQPVQGPSYPFLRYTVEQNLQFSGFIARSWANKSVESRS